MGTLSRNAKSTGHPSTSTATSTSPGAAQGESLQKEIAGSVDVAEKARQYGTKCWKAADHLSCRDSTNPFMLEGRLPVQSVS